MDIKKKPKKKSWTAQLNAARERTREAESSSHRMWKNWRETQDELDSLRKIMPLKYYRIKFKMMANSKSTHEFTHIVESYSPALAIEKLKRGKSYPNTFELLDITLLGE